MKKFIALVLVMVMCVGAGIGGTLAYLTDRETETNVFTVGDVEIELHADFEQGSKLLPGLKYETNVVIENVGTNDAWVFYDYAVPSAYAPIVNATFAGADWATVKVLETKMDVNGVDYTVYGILYENPLKPGDKTEASKISFGIESNVDIEDGKWVKVEKGVVSEIAAVTDVAPVAYINARAIQVEEFENNAEAAIEAYIGQWGGLKVDNAATPILVGTVEEFTEVLKTASAPKSGNTSIALTSDLDMSEVDWTPIKVEGYQGAGVVTIDGGNNTITGLDAPLFAGGFAGKSGIVIKDLTIADSNIVSTSGLGGGAFVDTADSMQVITLENCHLVNSTVSGERAGGLVGWVSGYANLSDGPVKTYVTIKDCSVKGSTINGNGSVGGIVGHPGASDYTYTTIENCTVLDTKLNSADNGTWRTGQIVGTANNGHVIIKNCTVGGNTLTQATTSVHEAKYENGIEDGDMLVGRFVPAGTGTLEINGISEVAIGATEIKGQLNDSTTTNVVIGQDIVMGEDGFTDTYGNIGLNVKDGKTLDLNQNTIIRPASGSGSGVVIPGKATTTVKNGSIINSGDMVAVDIAVGATATFENVDFVGNGDSMIRLRASNTAKTTLIFEDCTFKNAGVEFSGMNGACEIDVKFINCTFEGSYKMYDENGNLLTDPHGNVHYTSRIIDAGSNYLYGSISFDNCEFDYDASESKYARTVVEISGPSSSYGKTLTVTLKDVTIAGEKIVPVEVDSRYVANVTIVEEGTNTYTNSGVAVNYDGSTK